MNRISFSAFLLLVLLSACTPPQQVLSSWVNREALPKQPYKSVFVMSLTREWQNRLYIENEMAKLIVSRGQKAVKSSDVLTPAFMGADSLTSEILVKAVKQSGCEAVIILALLDIKTEESYQPERTFYPTAAYYGSYGRYYGHYYYEETEPGYITQNLTYFIETNFYDAATEKHLYSIQSDAYNPTDLKSFFKDYSKMLLKQLNKEGVLKK